MTLTLEEVARGLAILDGRQQPNAEDWQLARIAHPRLAALPEPSPHDVAVAEEILDQLGPFGGDPEVDLQLDIDAQLDLERERINWAAIAEGDMP